MLELLQQVANGLVAGSVYVLISLGLTVIFGILHIPHFAHGAVAMLGGYVSYWIGQRFGVGMIPSMAVGMLSGAVVGVLIEQFAYRPVRDAPPVNAFIVALGLTILLEHLSLFFWGADQVVIQTPYRGIIDIGGVVLTELRLYVLLFSVALIIAIGLIVKFTKTGKAIRALAQNRDAAILMGIDARKISAVVFGAGSALGVAAGTFVGALYAIAPGVGEQLIVKAFAILILGGLGSMPGAVIGGFVLGISESVAAGFVSSAYKDVIAFLIMIAVLFVRPAGIFSER